jgi:hypothetical protein
MRNIVCVVVLAVASFFLVSVFVPSLEARMNLLTRGVIIYSLRAASAAPRQGFVATYSVWQKEKLLGHILGTGEYVPIGQEVDTTRVIGFAAIRLFLGIGGIIGGSIFFRTSKQRKGRKDTGV